MVQIAYAFIARTQHEEALITDEDRGSYPGTAAAAGEEAMASFKHVLEHAIDIQVGDRKRPALQCDY